MHSPRSKLFATALVAATPFILAGCGSDSPTDNGGDALSAVEAQFLVAEFFDLLELIEIPLLDGGAAAVASGPAQTPYGELYDDQISGIAPCDGGGLASVDGLITGDVDEQAGTADISVTATADFAGCVVPGETVSFTLNGAPDVGLSADIDITETAITISVAIDGAVAYASTDGRSGTCTMDLTVDANAGSTGVSEVLSGSACGTPASQFQLTLFD